MFLLWEWMRVRRRFKLVAAKLADTLFALPYFCLLFLPNLPFKVKIQKKRQNKRMRGGGHLLLRVMLSSVPSLPQQIKLKARETVTSQCLEIGKI